MKSLLCLLYFLSISCIWQCDASQKSAEDFIVAPNSLNAAKTTLGASSSSNPAKSAANAATKAEGVSSQAATSAKMTKPKGDGVFKLDIVEKSMVEPQKGSTALARSLQKHQDVTNPKRKPELWGQQLKGSMDTWHEQALKHYNDIIKAPGHFERIKTPKGQEFLEKRLADGRGIRLELDSTFKNFID